MSSFRSAVCGIVALVLAARAAADDREALKPFIETAVHGRRGEAAGAERSVDYREADEQGRLLHPPLEHKVYATHQLYLAKDFKSPVGKVHPAAAITFSDFRTVGGLSLPHKKRNRFGSPESPEWEIECRLSGR